MRGIHAILSDNEADNIELAQTVAIAAAAAVPFLQPLPRNDAARLCWRMIAHHVGYFPEYGVQMVRMPWRLLADGVGDCKSQAVFIGSMCARSGCAVVIRFVQLPGTDYFGHVFAVVDGVPVDPLLEYGAECDYLSACDVRIS